MNKVTEDENDDEYGLGRHGLPRDSPDKYRNNDDTALHGEDEATKAITKANYEEQKRKKWAIKELRKEEKRREKRLLGEKLSNNIEEEVAKAQKNEEDDVSVDSDLESRDSDLTVDDAPTLKEQIKSEI